MAKKKPQNPQKLDPDLELLIHKYARIYIDDEALDNALAVKKEGEEDTNYIFYDAKRVYYPYYKVQVAYRIAKMLKLHPILEELLHIISELEKMQDKSTIATLKDITQLDGEIFHSILSDLEIKGYVENLSGVLKLSKNGKELLQKRKERVIEQSSAFVQIDAIFGDVVAVAQRDKDIRLEDRADKEAIELKPEAQKRPRTQELHNENFKDNLTLEQVLREALSGTDDRKSQNADIESKEEYDIVAIDEIKEPRKFFTSYFCLFYKNAQEREKILVINEKYERDPTATKLFDTLIDTSKFNANNNKAFQENIEKFSNLTAEAIQKQVNLELDLNEGVTIETTQHKEYLLYALKNAKTALYIHSPWVRYNIIKEYEKHIESALQKGVKVFIKYGLKARNKTDKPPIDTESTKLFDKWGKAYPNFKAITDNNHSKILICDSDFMIVGSFNWLSFGGFADKDGDTRGEVSSIVRNKDSIQKEIGSFKNTR
ncbi:phospholipase D-like domain-containing protein [uncultured Helicobacter sp.]|uniref:phospholipase D-like domain-containing protein n=1 Tax=uncultured Helicobacter sp. TaxID=175537 RepID=UPI00261774F0|nr:phospholipase D-like domain-containing protein [uncultured Helicobacter sp.]